MTSQVMETMTTDRHDAHMTSQMLTNTSDRTDRSAVHRLRWVLRANAVSSAISGVVLAAAPDALADVLEVSRPGWVRVVGLALLPFAAFVAWLSTASVDPLRLHTPGIVVGDLGWVAASIVTLLLGWYSGAGIALVIAMAVLVDTFAFLQWRAWRRL